MYFGLIGAGDMTQLVPSQLRPIAAELGPVQRDTFAAERGRGRSGRRL
jgi:hypothetical protein